MIFPIKPILLKKIIRTNYAATAKQIIGIISDTLKEFRGRKQPEDDVTMVVIKVEDEPIYNSFF